VAHVTYLDQVLYRDTIRSKILLYHQLLKSNTLQLVVVMLGFFGWSKS